MRIALLSDTHSFFDSGWAPCFEPVDEIWHAGDVGDPAVISALEKLKPVRAVFGNIDEREIKWRWPEDYWVEIGCLLIWMTHIAGSPPRYTARVKKQLALRKPQVLIGGHSHICRIEKDEKNHLLYLNPGAAGNHGFHGIKTMMRFALADGKVQNMEVIELGKRGAV